MIKIKILAILLLLITLTQVRLPLTAYGQDFDAEKAFKDYLYIHSQYHLAHRDYLNARSAYLNYHTLTAKEEAKQKTLKMLQLRDESLRTYLNVLKFRLIEAEGIQDFEKSKLTTLIDSETDWYVSHREELTSAGSLEDLVDLSDEGADQWKTTQAIAYKALTAILTGKQQILRQQINDKINQIEMKLAEIRVNDDKNTASLERWLLESKNRRDKSQQKQDHAEALTDPLIKEGSKEFSEARILIQESNQYLKESNSYLKEIIREVKIAD